MTTITTAAGSTATPAFSAPMADPMQSNLSARPRVHNNKTLDIRLACMGAICHRDPVRFWLALDKQERIGRVCTLHLSNAVAVIRELWVQPDHVAVEEAGHLLLKAAFTGIMQAGCVKLFVDASIAHNPAWAGIVRDAALTLRPRPQNRRWHEYYVNIYCNGIQPSVTKPAGLA